MDILAPSGDYDAYPVIDGDRQWVRVRTADGMVGWLIADSVQPVE